MDLNLEGDFYTDLTSRLLYATDASVYREVPVGVARPRNAEDIRKLIVWAYKMRIPLIPRAAGTSLAGQVVGNGLVVDVSRYMTRILEINPEEHWIRVEPGVILDELNKAVESYGLFFGPETSTSSRCMIGGMVGNNACGAHSILYGSTRDHVLSLKCLLSDGTEAEFTDMSIEEVTAKTLDTTLEGKVYKQIVDILSNPVNQDNIRKEFPDPRIHRRNTGYAIDQLLAPHSSPVTRHSSFVTRHSSFVTRHSSPVTRHSSFVTRHSSLVTPFNLSKLICGSEGTLAFVTEIKLNLVPLPPKEKALVCVHCESVAEALHVNMIALKYNPGAVELMDKQVMDCTRENITKRKNRFFIQGDPGAVLIVEFARKTREEIMVIAGAMEQEMRTACLGYHFPIVFPPDMKRVWDLRKAGLGVLSNFPGDRKPVAVTEDTAVTPESLPAYIAEFSALLERLGLHCVYHAHAGSGELHLRPILNLKNPADVKMFHTVALETAKLVKKYHGSLSGEHGDGRLRGEFIPLMIGQQNYQLLKQIKHTWDPDNIFNPGKITDTPEMNSSLRYQPGSGTPEIETIFDFSSTQGILRAAEQCNGSGDCRNSVMTGQWMCPSYMAVKDEQNTTRARANILREFLTNSIGGNPFNHKEIYEVMDLCLSCKACKSECPSNVDMTKLKAEFLQHYYDANGIPLRSWLIANITRVNKLGSMAPFIYNYIQRNKIITGLIKNLTGIATKRNFPLIYQTTLRSWAAHQLHISGLTNRVYLFVDEFTNYNDVEIGIKAIKLLHALGYQVMLPDHEESGRTYLSKGMVRKAKKLANINIRKLRDLITSETPLIGLEPSAILTLRDEYPDLAESNLKKAALEIAHNTFLIEEFLIRYQASNLTQLSERFTTSPKKIKLHGHCYQKALASVDSTKKMLEIPVNYKVEEIKSGCCGMAGSFGFEMEHYEVSMKIGELVLFPEVRKAADDVIIAAPGTSCRQQIMDGTGRRAWHPVEILYDALH